MAITQSFRDAVDNNEIRKVRIMMKDSLLGDPTFHEFNEMEKIASILPGLYDEHDGSQLETNEEKWNKDYMDSQMVKLIRNFSHERVNNLKDVIRKLYPVNTTTSDDNSKSEKFTSRYEHQKEMSYKEAMEDDMRNGDYRGTKIAVGAVIGAGVGAVVAAAISFPESAVVAGTCLSIGAGACAGAGAAYLLTK